MSYGSSASISLGTSLAGATQEGVLYVDRTFKLASSYPSFTFDDGTGPYEFGLGLGPMATTSGASNGIIALQGVLHVEDPGVGLNNLIPGVFVQSRTRSPQIVIQNANNYSLGVSGNRLTFGVNASANLIGPGNVDDVIFDASVSSASSPFIRFGQANYHLGPTVLGPLVSIGATAANAVVGIGQDRPKATLHAGCGTSTPVTTGTVAFVTNFGDVALAVNDNTNRIEVSLGVGASVPYVGTATAHDLRIRTNNTNRGIVTQTGNLFMGSTSPATYNPETSVIGLTGFPSAALSIAGNQTADGSVGQVAWYNDAAGLGTRVASVQVKRASANNNSTMTLATMNAGTLTPSLFIGATQWVGILNSNPQAALDVTGTIRFSGPLMPGINPGLSGQYLQSAGAGSSPVWATSVGTPGGPNTAVQFNAANTLYGSTNFTWNDSTSVVGITGTATISSNVGIGLTSTSTALLNVGVSGTSKAAFRIQPGTAPTSPNDGDIWTDDTQKSLAVVTGRLKSNISGVFLVSRSTTNVASTNVETSVLGGATLNGTQSLPANLMQAGKVLRITLGGFLSAGAGETLQFVVKFGSTVVADTGAMTLAATSAKSWTADITVIAANTSTLYSNVRFVLDTAAAGTPFIKTVFQNGTAFTAGSAYTLDTTAKWGSSSASNSLSTGIFISEILN